MKLKNKLILGSIATFTVIGVGNTVAFAATELVGGKEADQAEELAENYQGTTFQDGGSDSYYIELIKQYEQLLQEKEDQIIKYDILIQQQESSLVDVDITMEQLESDITILEGLNSKLQSDLSRQRDSHTKQLEKAQKEAEDLYTSLENLITANK